MQDETDDESLMARYANGDSRAFDTLFRRYAPRVRAFFGRSFSDGATCDDLLQITFLTLHRTRESFDPKQSFRPWLYTLAARVRIDELRRQYRAQHHRELSLDEPPVRAEASDDTTAEVQDLRRRVRSALAELPEAQRSVVLLHRFEGMTFGEIATILSAVEGRPLQEGAVRVRAFRAYATLRNVLVGPDEEAEGAIE